VKMYKPARCREVTKSRSSIARLKRETCLSHVELSCVRFGDGPGAGAYGRQLSQQLSQNLENIHLCRLFSLLCRHRCPSPPPKLLVFR